MPSELIAFRVNEKDLNPSSSGRPEAKADSASENLCANGQ
jgi:hypothetical protein